MLPQRRDPTDAAGFGDYSRWSADLRPDGGAPHRSRIRWTHSDSAVKPAKLSGNIWGLRHSHSRPGSRVVTSWTSHRLPSGSLKEQNDP